MTMMTRVVVLVALLLGSTTAGSAQSPHPSISLEAVSANAGNARNYTWQSEYGSYQFTSASFKALGVTVRNLGQAPAAVRLEWFFFGAVNGTIPRLIFDGGQKEMSVPGRQEQRLGVQSIDVKQEVTLYASVGERQVRGLEVSGWMVRVLAGERLLGVVGSSVPLEELGKNTTEVRESLALSRRLLGSDMLPTLYPAPPQN